MELEIATLNRDVERETLTLKRIEAELRKVIVGQEYLLDRLLVGLLANGHVLLEGVPGLAKTLAVKTLAQTLATRVPAHPVHARPAAGRPRRHADLQPAGRRRSRPRKGPVFANLVLADEINRAPAKVQSALLEAMQERQVTIGDETLPLPEPFLVLATQNPIEQEGTYPLPEAQVDRFMLKLRVAYPEPGRGERDPRPDAVDRRPRPTLRPWTASSHPAQPRERGRRDLRRRQDQGLHPRPGLRDARARGQSSCATWSHFIPFGASPRATIYLTRAAKALALSCAAAATSSPRTSRSSAPTCCGTASSSPTKPRREDSHPDAVVAKLLDRIQVP